MRVLGIVHHTDTGAGVFADPVAERGHTLDTWLISSEPEPPAPVERYEAVLVFGGAMHVDQEDRHGWLHDERLSTVEAERRLRDAGLKGRDRRAVVDATAAQVILQSWLDTHRG